ncbi:tabserin-like [Convolutriloba macropyga]|uniref:tabserin-like n=1 Tax=Convolutriloba macropyga TaxID=536237 RepID=UPI003F51E5F5
MTARYIPINCLAALTFVAFLTTMTPTSALNSLENPLVRRESVGTDEKLRSKRDLGWSTANVDAPFVVAIMRNGDVICSGAILSNMTVITAEACFEDTNSGEYRVIAGVTEIDWDSWEMAIPIADIKALGLPNDPNTIVLVILSEELELTGSIQVVNLITAPKSIESFTSDAARLVIFWEPPGHLDEKNQMLNAGIATSSLLSRPLCSEVNVRDNNGAGTNLNTNDFGCLRAGACPHDNGAPVVYEDPVTGKCYLDGVLVRSPSCDISPGISVYKAILPIRGWILEKMV